MNKVFNRFASKVTELTGSSYAFIMAVVLIVGWLVSGPLLGFSDTWQYCYKSGLKGKQIHWANISREYKEDLDDWIRLCQSCHKKYDIHKLTLLKKGGRYVMA